MRPRSGFIVKRSAAGCIITLFDRGILQPQERLNNASPGGLRRREDELRAVNCTAVTGSNDSGTIKGAQFVFTTPQPTGSGVIKPFLLLGNTPGEHGSDQAT